MLTIFILKYFYVMDKARVRRQNITSTTIGTNNNLNLKIIGLMFPQESDLLGPIVSITGIQLLEYYVDSFSGIENLLKTPQS